MKSVSSPLKIFFVAVERNPVFAWLFCLLKQKEKEAGVAIFEKSLQFSPVDGDSW